MVLRRSDEVLAAQRRATSAFRGLVVPVIAPLFSSEAGEWVNAESEVIDVDKGVDWIVMRRGGGALPVAARVQYGRGQEHATFTLRNRNRRSEFAKRAREAHDGSGYRLWYVHAYVDEDQGRLLSVGVVHHDDLWAYIPNRPLFQRVNSQDGAKFVVIPWHELAAARLPSFRAVSTMHHPGWVTADGVRHVGYGACTGCGRRPDGDANCKGCGLAGHLLYLPGPADRVRLCAPCWHEWARAAATVGAA